MIKIIIMAIMELNRDKRKNYLVNFDHNCDRNFYVISIEFSIHICE